MLVSNFHLLFRKKSSLASTLHRLLLSESNDSPKVTNPKKQSAQKAANSESNESHYIRKFTVSSSLLKNIYTRLVKIIIHILI